MRRVAITGGAHGLGAALAHAFADKGDAVAVLDLDAAGAATRAGELATRARPALGIGCDVTDPGACRAAFDGIVSELGGLDVLVANAGITHLGSVVDTGVDVLRRVMEVNFFGAVNATRAALPALLETGGQVVAISSVAGFAPLATRAGYVASKHAVEGFFGTLRTEHVAHGLGVTLVRPSFVRTEIGLHALGPDGREAGRDTRTGVAHELSAKEAAETILRGVSHRRRVVFVGREARLAFWASRLWPQFYERQMRRRALS